MERARMFERMILGLVLVVAGLAFCLPAQANPVVGKILPLRQPDGTQVDVRIWGDEFYTVVESLDGYTLVRDPATHVICYARLSEDGNNLISTGVAVGQSDPVLLGLELHVRINPAAATAQAQAVRADFLRREQEGPLAPLREGPTRGPTTGNVVGLCLIIDFSDDVGTISPTTVQNYCNQVGYTGYGNNGSVRDYFYDVSNHLLTYTNFVPAAYYRAAHPKSYYTDPNIPYGQRARELIVEALTYLNPTVDFSQFDADDNGVVDALNCYYAGYSNSAWAEGLWPHASSVYFAADGVHTNRYQITDMQNSLTLSTFCHENGHMLMGWPDLYDYGYDSTGVGQFCIMCYGTTDTNPCHPCAYMKYIAGWANVTVVTSSQLGLVVPAGNTNVAYKFPHPTLTNEYYLIENRQKTGRDSGLPDHGLAIWHIDTNGDNDYQQQTPQYHYLVTLVQADGRWDLEHDRNYGDTTDLWAAPTYTQCTPTTSPNTNWWSGSSSDLSFTNISASGATMTFDFGHDCNHNGVLDELDISGGTSHDCNGNGIPDECDIADGASADCDSNGYPDECDQDVNSNGVPDACELATPMGLAGAYYDNVDFTGTLRGRIDATIDFDWGTGSPWTGFGGDTFSVRWTGYVKTNSVTGAYMFFPRTSDGVRLWVKGQKILDKWIDQNPTEWPSQIYLQADSVYRFVMEYYHNAGSDAVAELRWQPPGGSYALVPAANLMPGNDCNGNGVLDDVDIALGTVTDANGDGLPDVCSLRPGDTNCDDYVTYGDINPFVVALGGESAFHAQYPYCNWINADCNDDGLVTYGDINAFVALLNQ